MGSRLHHGYLHPTPTPSAGGIKKQVFWNASITALGGLLFGYDTGVISGALLFIGKDFTGLTATDKELLTSLLLIGAVVGALFAGRVADRIGRRPTVLATAAILVIGVTIAAFAPGYGVLVVARVIIGVAVGSSSMVVPLHIGETAPLRIRGALVSFNQLAVTIGIVTSYLVDFSLASSENWRLMFGLAAIPGILMFVGMLFQRESPHWLVVQGRVDEARTVLAQVRDAEAVEPEIAEVREAAQDGSSTRELFDPEVRHALTVGVALAVFQQITGINTIIYHAPTVLSNAGLGDSAALLANVVNGGVNVGMTIVAILLLDPVGRRPLLLVGTASMVVGMATHGLTILIGGNDLPGVSAYVAIAGLLVYTGSLAIGLGPGVLAADQRDLPHQDPRTGDERGHHRQLGRTSWSPSRSSRCSRSSATPGRSSSSGA